MVNWAKNHNQSLAAIANRGLWCTPCVRVKAKTEPRPSCTAFLTSESTLINDFLVRYFDQQAEVCLIQSELHNYILICILIYQSEQPHNNQSEYGNLANLDSATWPNQNAWNWIPYLHKDGPIRDQGRDILYVRGAPLCLPRPHFQFPSEAVFPRFANCVWNKFLPLHCVPNWGLLLVLGWWQQPFINNTLSSISHLWSQSRLL